MSAVPDEKQVHTFDYARWKLFVLRCFMRLGLIGCDPMEQFPPLVAPARYRNQFYRLIVPKDQLEYAIYVFKSARPLLDHVTRVDLLPEKSESASVTAIFPDHKEQWTVGCRNRASYPAPSRNARQRLTYRIRWLMELAEITKVEGPDARVMSFDISDKQGYVLSGDSSVAVWDADAVKAAFEVKADMILNLASELRPGGGFTWGMMSQEEALCSSSDLLLHLPEAAYPLGDSWLENKSVTFYQRQKSRTDLQERRMAVMTVAAVKIGSPEHPAWTRSAESIMDRKIRAVVKVARQYDCSVLGALGCGAYGNDANYVAEAFARAFSEFGYRRVVFAILDNPKLVRTFEAAFQKHKIVKGEPRFETQSMAAMSD